MEILKCIICNGEMELIDPSHVEKKVRCKKCGFTNEVIYKPKEPEIIIVRKRF